MASGTVILRPSGDDGGDHKGYPEDTTLYKWISEKTCDGDGSYIYYSRNLGLSEDGISRYYLSGAIPTVKIKVTGVKVRFAAKSTDSGVASFVSFEVRVPPDSYYAYGTDQREAIDYLSEPETLLFGDDLVERINTYIGENGNDSLTNLMLLVRIKAGYYSHGTSSSVEYVYDTVRVSQVYLEIDYEEILDIGVFRKVNGAVKAAVEAYKKVGGTWQEIDEAEAKSILKNNTITQGGS